MAYDINLTNGNLLATLNDGEINTSNCSLSLIGRNVSVYGERINENLVRLLENFANNVAPSNPLDGQLWYDNSSKQLKLRNGSSWQGINTFIKSSSAPDGLEEGDLWFDTTNRRVYLRDSSSITGLVSGFRLLGPIASKDFGDTRLMAESFASTDASGNHEVLTVFVAGIRLAVFSNDSQYTTAVSGFGTVKPGINVNSTVASAVLNGTATNSNALNSLTSSQFMRSDTDTTNTGNVTVTKRLIMTSGQGELLTSNVAGYGSGSNDFTILRNTVNNVGLSLRSNYFGVDKDFLIVDTGNNRVVINSDLAVLGSFTASSASALASPVTISLSGNVSGSVSFNGSTNVNIVTTLDTERLKLSGGTMTGLLNADQGFIASSSSTANLIYATGSRVGILNSNPAVALDVVGAIRTVPVVNGSTSGSVTVDAQHNNHQINLSGSATISFSNFYQPGQLVRLVITGTENTVSWNENIYWPNGASPNFANGTYKIAVITLMRPNTIVPGGPRPDDDFILATYVSY